MTKDKLTRLLSPIDRQLDNRQRDWYPTRQTTASIGAVVINFEPENAIGAD